MSNSIPSTGIKGLKENWRSDLTAAVSVALVALPLALGIAVASGVTPMSGLLSAIVAGIVTTFFRGSNLAINGPAAGLIAAILGGLAVLDNNINYAITKNKLIPNKSTPVRVLSTNIKKKIFYQIMKLKKL